MSQKFFDLQEVGLFDLQEVWLLDDLSLDDAASLMKALADWRKACLSRLNCPQMTSDEIIDVRDALLAKGDIATLSMQDQDLFRDCDMALGVVRCSLKAREEARVRIASKRFHEGSIQQ